MASSSKRVRYGDDDFEETVLRWADECNDELSSGESENSDKEGDGVIIASDEDSDFVIESNSSDSDSDIEENDGNVCEQGQNQYFVAPSGILWQKTEPAPTKIPSYNIIRTAPGLKKKNLCGTPTDAFSYFITKSLLEEIIICTNLEAKRVTRSKNKQWQDVDMHEMLAFIGLIIQAGFEKNWDVSVRELFTGENANPIYRATMALRRFESIRRYLRFDDKRTRGARLETDKLAPISYIWNLFIDQCRKCIVPDKNVTIDEQLVPYRGRCRFTQYMPSKPAKYGLKIFWMCESATGFAIDGMIYVGRQPGEAIKKHRF